ncbi:MAG: hypothetical protein HC852_14675 [Acaryochloridaceae cyanobacterium RU_4_10]|nr:hypothetical protein [Acaryochloridaceae cyanobacterium RU_4_10]
MESVAESFVNLRRNTQKRTNRISLAIVRLGSLTVPSQHLVRLSMQKKSGFGCICLSILWQKSGISLRSGRSQESSAT